MAKVPHTPASHDEIPWDELLALATSLGRRFPGDARHTKSVLRRLQRGRNLPIPGDGALYRFTDLLRSRRFPFYVALMPGKKFAVCRRSPPPGFSRRSLLRHAQLMGHTDD